MKADLHIHSVYSNDGKSTLEQIADAALSRGLGCIAVTDHNCFKAYDLLKDRKDMIIVPGIEVSSAEGHILAYGVGSDIERGMSVIRTIEAIHDAGGIAVAAHPYRWWSGLGEKNVVTEFDGVEGFNSRSKKRDNARSFRLGMSMNKPLTGGSDSHTPDAVGDAYTIFPDGLSTKDEIIASILRHETEVDGKSRSASSTLKYGTKSITEWIGRGFKRM